MGWLFRNSIKIFPGVRLNFGKKGITSATIGKGGWFSTNVNSKGVRHNLSVPGTGITYQTPRSGGQPQSARPLTQQPYRYQALATTWPCDRCGNLNPQMNNFCGNCGQSSALAVRGPIQPIQVPASTDTTRNALLVGGILVSVMVVCGLCTFSGMLSSPGSSANKPAAFVSTVPTPSPSPSPTVAAKKIAPTKTRKNSVPSPTPTDGIYDAVPPSPGPTRRSSSSGGYITGPRGGCYYINSRGNKTYVDHSYCN